MLDILQRAPIGTNSSESAATAGTRISIWDGWRGIAILLVLCGHFVDILWIHEDRMGVDVFFVLSGMLMSIILFEKRISLRDFYIRRFSRIFPVLILLVVVMFSYSALTSIPFLISEIPASLLFMRTYFPPSMSIWETQTSTGHLWSLNVEEHAYMILSAITLFMINKKHIAIVLLSLATTCIIISFFYSLNTTPEQFELKSIRTESAASFIFFSAGYGLLKRQYNWQLAPWFVLLCFGMAILCYVYKLPLHLRYGFAPIMLGVVVNHLDQIPTWFHRILSLRIIGWFGICSYSIYMWQQVFFEYAWALPGERVTGLICAITVGVTCYYFFENPIRHSINNRWSPKPVYKSK